MGMMQRMYVSRLMFTVSTYPAFTTPIASAEQKNMCHSVKDTGYGNPAMARVVQWREHDRARRGRSAEHQ